ncbi:MAG: 4Fe-4S binding protein [Myxococcales bacterium]|nr:4Fe-4S binding protein [Myxococcales bacterium]
MNRRQFLFCTAATLAGTACSGGIVSRAESAETWPTAIRATTPQKALVTWYSQTGHTRRIGRLIGKVLEKEGLQVTALPLAEVDTTALPGYDLLVLGTPVYYFDVPVNVAAWLRRLPALTGIPAASFVTFGGEGSNPHNTAVRLLRLLADRGAVPVGLSIYANMSTYAPTWSMGSAARTLAYRDLPDEKTFERARAEARAIADRVRRGQAIRPDKEFNAGEIWRLLDSQDWTRMLISGHRINEQKCIRCGTCVRTCPAGAIRLDPARIDHRACLACFGCVNNCPADAQEMRFLRYPVQGFESFKKAHAVTTREPAELLG